MLETEPTSNKWRNRLLALLCLVTLAAIMLDRITGCGVEPAKPKPTVQAPPPPPQCDKVNFANLQPIIQDACVSCHNGMDTYDVAKAKYSEMDRRIHSTGPDHMPLGSDLTIQEKLTFDKWGQNGFLKAGDCTVTPPTPPQEQKSFADFESVLARSLAQVNIADKADIHWLVSLDRVNAGASEDNLKQYKWAAAKAINSVSLDNSLHKPVEIAPGVFQINIDDYGISPAEWTQIENADQLQLESFTSVGQFLKDTTHSRLPWLPIDSFNDDVLQNGNIYYLLTNTPPSRAQLEKNLGVDFAGDLFDTRAIQAGFNGSRLSPQANRMVARFDSDEGMYWITFDTGKIVSDKQNLFKNPCLVESGCKADLLFAASEVFYTLPNGLFGSALFNAAGQILNVADPNIVHDFTQVPTAPIIINALSCTNCHANGMIHFTDQVRNSVLQAGNEFTAQDAQIILALYKPQAIVDAILKEDNEAYAKALAEIGVDAALPDPIAVVSTEFRGEWNLERLCHKLFLNDLDDCRSQLNLSLVGKEQLGQLLTGGTATLDQIVQALPQIRQDLRLFQDPL